MKQVESATISFLSFGTFKFANLQGTRDEVLERMKSCLKSIFNDCGQTNYFITLEYSDKTTEELLNCFILE
jgi:hypothetical protein